MAKDKQERTEFYVPEFMQGVDCPYCEDGTPHTHRPPPAATPSPAEGRAPGDKP